VASRGKIPSDRSREPTVVGSCTDVLRRRPCQPSRRSTAKAAYQQLSIHAQVPRGRTGKQRSNRRHPATVIRQGMRVADATLISTIGCVSRGPGRWQRAILDRVEEGPCWLAEIYSDGASRPEREAIARAARTLRRNGLISTASCWAVISDGRQAPAVVVGPPGCDFQAEGFLPVLSRSVTRVKIEEILAMQGRVTTA
jgi:hypothetical protein